MDLFHAILTLGLPGSLSWWYSHGLTCTVEPIAIPPTTETSKNNSNYVTSSLLQVHTPRISFLGESFQEVLPPPSQPSLRPVVVTPAPTMTAFNFLHVSDARFWLQPANKTELGLCWPDYRLVETVQAGLQILFAVLLLFFCVILIIRLRKSRKLEICRGDFTFLAMPRDRPSEKFTYHPLSTSNTFTRDISRPLPPNDPPTSLARSCLAQDTPPTNQKAGSTTVTQSTSSERTESDSNPRVPSSAAPLQASLSTVVVFPLHRRVDAGEEEKASLMGTWSEPNKTAVRILRTEQPFRANISTGRARGFSPLTVPQEHPVSGSHQNLTSKQRNITTLNGSNIADDRGVIGRTRYRITSASSVSTTSLVESSTAAPAATTSRQLAQLQEYSRRIAKITRSHEARFSSSSAESQERRRYTGLPVGSRIHTDSGHASSPTTTTTTTTDASSVLSAMDRSDQLLLNQRQQALRNLSLADILHPRQQSAPAAEVVGTTDSSGSSRQNFCR
ncbi:hypothetical protein AAHC03_05082 [Spirometra sp. Aus1]